MTKLLLDYAQMQRQFILQQLNVLYLFLCASCDFSRYVAALAHQFLCGISEGADYLLLLVWLLAFSLRYL